MSERESSGNADLTGYWSGEYWYQHGAMLRTSFAAHISETAGSFTGTTLETSSQDGEVSATIVGAREGSSVTFTKRYDPRSNIHPHPIYYTGLANGDLTVIEGEWVIPVYRDWRGGFRMQRGGKGPKAAVKREARAPVLAGVESRRGQVSVEPRKPKRK